MFVLGLRHKMFLPSPFGPNQGCAEGYWCTRVLWSWTPCFPECSIPNPPHSWKFAPSMLKRDGSMTVVVMREHSEAWMSCPKKRPQVKCLTPLWNHKGPRFTLWVLLSTPSSDQSSHCPFCHALPKLPYSSFPCD